MTKVVIWHNPRCSKSRETLALLKERGHAVEERRYLEDPPTAEELHEVLGLLGLPAIRLIRKKEPEFKALGLHEDIDNETLIAAMAHTPKLIERPVVLANGKAALGRPPQAVLSIL